MFKKTFTLMTSLVFILGLSGLVLAQNTATVAQTSPVNNVLITQVGANDAVGVDQDAAISNDATAYQQGDYNTIVLDQQANVNSFNDANISQIGSGNNADVTQVTTGDWYNKAPVTQTGNDNDIVVNQSGSIWNVAGVSQLNYGTDNVMLINQVGVTGNYISSVQRASTAGLTATQASYSGRNDLQTNQYGSDTILLEQEGDGHNGVGIAQWGGAPNSVDAYQYAPVGSNELNIYQTGGGSSATVMQTTASGFNDLDITQSSVSANANVSQIATVGNNIAVVNQ